MAADRKPRGNVIPFRRCGETQLEFDMPMPPRRIPNIRRDVLLNMMVADFMPSYTRWRFRRMPNHARHFAWYCYAVDATVRSLAGTDRAGRDIMGPTTLSMLHAMLDGFGLRMGMGGLKLDVWRREGLSTNDDVYKPPLGNAFE